MKIQANSTGRGCQLHGQTLTRVGLASLLRYAIPCVRSALCRAGTAAAAGIHAHGGTLAGARSGRHQRGVQRHLCGADQPVPLCGRGPDGGTLPQGQGRQAPVHGVQRRATGTAPAGQKHRKRGRRGWMESHHDGWRSSRGCRGLVRLAERSQSLGCAAIVGPLADSRGRADGTGAGTRGGAGLPVLAKILQRRSGSRGAHHPTGAQELSDRGRDAAAVPLARGGDLRAAQGDAGPQHLFGVVTESPPGSDVRAGERGAAADSGAVREAVAGALSGYVPRGIAQHYGFVRQADGADALPAVRRGGVAAADRVRQRVDPAAGAGHAAAARTGGARGAGGGARQDCAAVAHGVAGDRRGGRGAGRTDRVEERGVYGRLAAVRFLPGGIGDRDESARADLQYRLLRWPRRSCSASRRRCSFRGRTSAG